MTIKKIAILGGGLCGLAAAIHLIKKQKDLNITLYDAAALGQNASGLSAGLLHPFPGAHAKLAPNAFEGQEATLALVKIAENALSEQISVKTGLLRLAVTQEQVDDFSSLAKRYPGIRWMDQNACRQLIPFLAPLPGAFIESAYTIQTKSYLNGLWKYCASNGVQWVRQNISSLDELSQFDMIIIAAGAAAKLIPAAFHLRLKSVKGQLLEIEWPEQLPPLHVPINSHAYLVMSHDKKRCFVGATYERNFDSEGPNMSAAYAHLHPKMVGLIPDLKDARILASHAGIRAATPTQQPLIECINAKCWFIGGMGSKGLIYHALYAHRLVNQILS